MTAAARSRRSRVTHLLVGASALCLACAPGATLAPSPSGPGDAALPGGRRPLLPFLDGRWIGNGVAYGPFRDGQQPGGPLPTREQLREDLELMCGRWGLLRLYGSRAPTPDLLALVREERLPFKILLGAWIAPETAPVAGGGPPAPVPGAREENAAEVAMAVGLANAYPDVVLGVCIGNETQVSWSAHRLPAETLVEWIREARRGTSLPVATADDFAFWLEPGSARVAREVDFLVVHVHPMWNEQPLESALAFTKDRFAQVARRHPGVPLVLGEAGWATRRHSEGEQARLIRGDASEEAQRRFHLEFTAWVAAERVVTTWFEAFDERWKGGPHPDEVEKHWGLFRADRTPKPALAPEVREGP